MYVCYSDCYNVNNVSFQNYHGQQPVMYVDKIK